MTPRELREAAYIIDRLCIGGSRGARSMPCDVCRVHSQKLRDFAEEIDPMSKRFKSEAKRRAENLQTELGHCDQQITILAEAPIGTDAGLGLRDWQYEKGLVQQEMGLAVRQE